MPKILLVEDNEMNRDMLSRRLLKAGFEMVIAVDGERAIDLARSEAPDLILMDISLPGLDGGSDPPAQSHAGNPVHSHYCPHRSCHGGRPGKIPGRRLQ